jgi:hypothetical protein
MTDPGAASQPLSVQDLVARLGGPTQVARQLGVAVPAVCNWQARDRVPQARRLGLWRLAHAAGLPWRPPGFDGVELAPAAAPIPQQDAA